MSNTVLKRFNQTLLILWMHHHGLSTFNHLLHVTLLPGSKPLQTSDRFPIHTSTYPFICSVFLTVYHSPVLREIPGPDSHTTSCVIINPLASTTVCWEFTQMRDRSLPQDLTLWVNAAQNLAAEVTRSTSWKIHYTLSNWFIWVVLHLWGEWVWVRVLLVLSLNYRTV